MFAVVRITCACRTRGKRSQLIEKIFGRGQVLDHIERENIVEAFTGQLGYALIQVSEEEVVESSGESAALDVAANDYTSFLLERCADGPHPRAEVEDARSFGHEFNHARMGAFEIELRGIAPAILGPARSRSVDHRRD